MKQAFRVTQRKVIFSKGPIHLVDCHVLMPSGRRLSRQIIEHPGSVVIIPKTPDGKFVLIRQFRFAARDWLYEFPAGGVEASESFRKAAARELMEETGFRPRRLRFLVKIFPTPGISGEMMYLFLAEGLVPQRLECDEDEELEVVLVTEKKLERMILSGKIRDAKTILGFLYLKRYRSTRLRRS